MADLNYLNFFTGKKIVIIPCLIELGHKSAEIHREIGKKIAGVCDLAIITTKEKFEEIKSGAVVGGMPADKIVFSENPKEIFNLVKSFCSGGKATKNPQQSRDKEGDAVLLEGRVPSELIKLLITK